MVTRVHRKPNLGWGYALLRTTTADNLEEFKHNQPDEDATENEELAQIMKSITNMLIMIQATTQNKDLQRQVLKLQDFEYS